MTETDHNLLFGVIAMQCDLIEREQFVDACALWASHKEISLAGILIQHGWMTTAEAQYVNGLLTQRLRRRSTVENDERPELEAADTLHPSAITSVIDRRPVGDLVPTGQPPGLTIEQLAARRARITLSSLYSTGGIGEVWRAHDNILDRDVALKRLKVDRMASKSHKERFYREACITGQLDHPGIVPVYDYHDEPDSDECYYTMRFVKGRTMSEVIDEYHQRRVAEGPSAVMGDFLQILNHFLSVCNTLAFAHSRQIIHRDLKGDNIIVGDFGEVIVLDWGVAKQLRVPRAEVNATAAEADRESEVETVSVIDGLSPSKTVEGAQLGTPAYMAPEQAQGRIDLIDYRTDVYGLAALLYQILTGRAPFQGYTVVGVLRSVVTTPPAPPTAIVGGIPPALERACLKGLAKESKERQQTVLELAKDVQDWLTARAEKVRAEMERERFFDLSLDLLAILEQGDRFTQTNAAWQTVLQWTNIDLKGQNLSRYVVAEDMEHVHDKLMAVWSEDPHIEFECRCRRADGAHRWIHFNARKIPGEYAIYLVGRDITERKQSEQKFQGILESAPDAMAVVDGQCHIVLVNAQLEKMFGYGREELLGQHLDILIPEPMRRQHEGHVARFVANPAARPMAAGLELYGERQDGTVFRVEISLSPVRTEEGLLISCALRDASHRLG